MSIMLGVDTGGTYTDAVLIENEQTVIATAKALTTKQDLSIGIREAISGVLSRANAEPGEIALASLSTTLATNALVEGQGGRVGLIYIGFDPRDIETHGLGDALRGDPFLVVAGGHSHAGTPSADLDTTQIGAWLETVSDVSAFAVAAQFATRNPEHELQAAELLRSITGRPVTCSHQLSARLNGPKRALTAVLNARLIGMIDQLISRTQDSLEQYNIKAPLMVVRGDGALISAEMARERPIETILSGPAASIVGAHWLTQAQNALVSDIGGTTTDIALLSEGRPAIDPEGARVGPYRTMVEAVAMRTTGLGGDSEVHFRSSGLQGGLTLGPQRVVPISLLATEAPELVHRTLDAQLRSALPGEHDGRFVRATSVADQHGLGARETVLLDRIGDQTHPVASVIKTRLDLPAMGRLLSRGIVQISAITPSDAAHALGLAHAWDAEAATKALRLFRQRKNGAGEQLAEGTESMAKMIIDQLTRQTVSAMLETVFAEDPAFSQEPEQLAIHELLRLGLQGHRGLIKLDAAVNIPVVGLGASAPTYYPAIGERLGCRMILPEHAGVANAIGAVVGQVTIRKTGTITAPSDGKYRLHLTDGPVDLGDREQAVQSLESHLLGQAIKEAEQSGAEGLHHRCQRDIRNATIDGREVFLQAEILVEVSGRPRVALETV